MIEGEIDMRKGVCCQLISPTVINISKFPRPLWKHCRSVVSVASQHRPGTCMPILSLKFYPASIATQTKNPAFLHTGTTRIIPPLREGFGLQFLPKPCNILRENQ